MLASSLPGLAVHPKGQDILLERLNFQKDVEKKNFPLQNNQNTECTEQQQQQKNMKSCKGKKKHM